MNHQFDDLKRQIGQVSRARRHLARSVEASGITLHRAISVDRRARDIAREYWPRPADMGSGRDSRAGIRLLLAVALLAVVVQLRWIPAEQRHANVAAEEVTTVHRPRPSTPLVASAAGASNAHPLMIHLQAMRPCRVRVVVDGTALEWRSLRQGDEFFSRPQHEFLIQSDDGGALSATVNGDPVSLGADGHAIAIRFTSARPFPEPASAR
jgi:hypothetical protein